MFAKHNKQQVDAYGHLHHPNPGRHNLKFIISMAYNPIGAKFAGDCGDGNSGGYFFDAKPGYVKNPFKYKKSKTFIEN